MGLSINVALFELTFFRRHMRTLPSSSPQAQLRRVVVANCKRQFVTTHQIQQSAKGTSRHRCRSTCVQGTTVTFKCVLHGRVTADGESTGRQYGPRVADFAVEH